MINTQLYTIDSMKAEVAMSEYNLKQTKIYAISDGYGIWLYVNDIDNPTDRIYIEPSVLTALNDFYNRELED